MRRHAKVLAVTVAAVAVLGLGWWGTSVLGIGDEVLPETMAQRIQASVDGLLSKLTPGTSLHIRMEMFNRHGSAASEIATIPWAMPETIVVDMRVGPIDDVGIFTGRNAIVKDGVGNIVQEVSTIGEEVVYRDIRLGEERRLPWVPMSAAGYLQAVSDTAQRLLEEGWNLVSYGTWDDRETVILQKLSTWTGITPEDGARSINIPYTLDLQPKKVLHRMEIVLDNPLLHSEQTWVIDQQGDKILVGEERWILVEVVD